MPSSHGEVKENEPEREKEKERKREKFPERKENKGIVMARIQRKREIDGNQFWVDLWSEGKND